MGHFAPTLESTAADFRAAGSAAHLGLIARLISVAIANAVTQGRVLLLDQATLFWQPALGGPFPLSIEDRFVAESSDRALVDGLVRHVIEGPVRRLTDLTGQLPISQRVLWGNVASAVNGASVMLSTHRPELAHRTSSICSSLLRQQPLAAHHAGGSTFRRTSCCLIYQLSPATADTSRAWAVCADCILPNAPAG